MSEIVIKFIRAYQYFSKNIGYNSIPLIVQPHCRYYPTCSDYAINSIIEYGFWRGSLKGFIRVLKCNPLSSCPRGRV